MKYLHLAGIVIPLFLVACQQASHTQDTPVSITLSSSDSTTQMEAIEKNVVTSTPQNTTIVVSSSSKNMKPTSDDQWREKLTEDQYAVLRENGTERPFTSDLLNEHRAGTYVTADCGDPVFRSEQKFDSGTGWPSFWAPISPNAVKEISDTTYGIQRTEIQSRCGGHLGHVFNDGPEPTGLRYCMNGVALKFIPDDVQP